MEIAKEDKLLWRVLTIMGVRISGYCLKPHEKYISYSIKFLSILVLFHWILASVRDLLYLTHIRELVFIIMPVQIVLLWHFLNSQKETMCYIIKKLYIYRNRYSSGNNQSCLLNTLIITILLFPAIISIVITIFDTKTSSTIWSFGYKINGVIFLQIATFYGNFIYYSYCTFIAFLAFSLSIVFYRWGVVLSGYKKLLETHLKEKKVKKDVHFLKDFFNIVKILQELKKALAYPTFILIIYGLEMIFILFYVTLVKKELISHLRYITRVVFNGICGFIMIMMYSVSCSMFSEQLIEIKNTATNFLNKYGENTLIPQNVIYCLKRIEKQDVVYISACGMFSINRQFILTAIGVALTYDLLIINFK